MARGSPRSLERANIVTQPFVVSNRVSVSIDGSSGAGWGTAVIGGLPEGFLSLKAAVAAVTVLGTGGTGIAATWSGDVAVGTTPTADNTLGGTDVNVTASTAIGPAVAGVIGRVSALGSTAVLLDNSGGSLELNLNVLVDDANVSGTEGTLDIDVVVWLDMTILGDD